MPHYRSSPTYDQDLTTNQNDGAKTTAAYYRWFQDIETGTPPSNELPIAVGASPFVYSLPRSGSVIVTGGTVVAIKISRSGTFYSTGQTQGAFQLAANDQIQVVYTGAPTMVLLPS